MVERDPGYYWIFFCGKWTIGKWVVDRDASHIHEQSWSVIGSDVPETDDEIDAVGPKLDPPSTAL